VIVSLPHHVGEDQFDDKVNKIYGATIIHMST